MTTKVLKIHFLMEPKFRLQWINVSVLPIWAKMRSKQPVQFFLFFFNIGDMRISKIC